MICMVTLMSSGSSTAVTHPHWSRSAPCRYVASTTDAAHTQHPPVLQARLAAGVPGQQCASHTVLPVLCWYVLQGALAPVLLRRMKEDVEDLPEKEEVVIWVELTAKQRRCVTQQGPACTSKQRLHGGKLSPGATTCARQ